jgi:hypothetical protein
MTHVFEESKDLVQIINSVGWSLYDLTNQPADRPFSWDEVNKMGQAEVFEIGHNYLFIPILAEGETLKKAYSKTEGVGPCLTIVDSNHDRWKSLIVHKKLMGYVAIFSRLWFEEEFVVASTPETDYYPDPDVVAMAYEYLIDTFRQYFGIIDMDLSDTLRVPPPPRISGLN